MAYSSSSTSRADGSSRLLARPSYAGELRLVDAKSDLVLATRRLYLGHDLTIGRDRNKCQWVLDDPQLSAKHLRIYTIVYDNEEQGYLENLVYAEDLSRNGTFWNDSLIGKGNGGFLLSSNDKLRLSSSTLLRFDTQDTKHTEEQFDGVQEYEMHHFLNEYVITDRLLGAGACGRVFMAIEQRTRTQLACKVVDLRRLESTVSKYFQESGMPVPVQQLDRTAQIRKVKTWTQGHKRTSQLEEKLKVYYREIDILSQLSHPNIIGVDKVYITDSTIYIFQDLITAGDLFSYLESKNGRLLEVEAAVIIRQVLIALKFLHDQHIVHRDLKPENIMMTSLSAGSRVVLTDFGAARRIAPCKRLTSMVGTAEYVAPEVIWRQKSTGNAIGYTKAVDMWSVGAITAVLLSGVSAFTDPSTGSYSAALARICNLDHFQRSKQWHELRNRPKDFIARILVLDESKRMTAEKALQHPWFSNKFHKTDFEELYQRTTKNWYPRVAKSPVVDSSRSTYVKNIVAIPVISHGMKRYRQELQAIDPPYKPFPRNMHISLWPKRKTSGNTMSDEVTLAISNNWTGKPKRSVPRFRPLSRPVQPFRAKLVWEDSMRPAEKGQEVSLQESSAIPVRFLRKPSKERGDDEKSSNEPSRLQLQSESLLGLTPRNMPQPRRTSFKKVPDLHRYAGRTAFSVNTELLEMTEDQTQAIITENMILKDSTGRDEPGFTHHVQTQPRSLRRKSVTFDIATPSKSRSRDGVFEVLCNAAEDSNSTSRNPDGEMHKRAELLRTGTSCDAASIGTMVVAHYRRSSLTDEELDE